MCSAPPHSLSLMASGTCLALELLGGTCHLNFSNGLPVRVDNQLRSFVCEPVLSSINTHVTLLLLVVYYLHISAIMSTNVIKNSSWRSQYGDHTLYSSTVYFS
uniref:Putative secreted protein n=1 Tax=Ixodes ricinus TaxID=34613 RepID=A0A6B0UCS2_IXORI